jgi:prophage regulatory protein
METRIIRKPELFSKLSLSDATIWRLERAGNFPIRIKLGGNSVGWFVNEVDEWLAKKASERPEARSAIIPERHPAKGGAGADQ